MIYLLWGLSLLGYATVCLVAEPVPASIALAATLMCCSLAAIALRRTAWIAGGAVSAVVLYLSTAVSPADPFDLWEALSLGSLLFVHLELSFDLALFRKRRVSARAYAPRLRRVGSVVVLASLCSVAALVFAAGAVEYLPLSAGTLIAVPALAAVVVVLGSVLVRSSEHSDDPENRESP